jgi:hypothetical protein
LVLADLIEIFERLLKELAAVCVDQIAGFVNDGRFDKFTAKGSQIVAHFGAKSIGKALCESDTWLNNNDINELFRNLLKLPFTDPDFNLFPKEDRSPRKGEGKAPKDLEKDRIKVETNDRTRTLAFLWQLRHNLTHNSGVLTGSDAMRLRMLSRSELEADRILVPSRADLRYVQIFLTETSIYLNNSIGKRLALLLTKIHEDHPAAFDNQAKADEISQIFRLSLEINKAVGTV